MVGVHWVGDPGSHRGAAILLVDDPEGKFQQWIRARCPSSVVQYYRTVAHGSRSEVWLRATQEVSMALEDRLDALFFDDGPYRGETLRLGMSSCPDSDNGEEPQPGLTHVLTGPRP
jgi:hypothetical protein